MNFKYFTICLLFLSQFCFSQKNRKNSKETILDKSSSEIVIPMNDKEWEGKAEFLTYKGKQAIKIVTVGNTEQVILKNHTFQNGTIEYDIEPYGSSSIYFRRNGYKEQEIFYLRERFDQPLANDAIQYCPVIDGVIMWDVYDHFQAPTLIKPNEWNHIKLVINGFQVRVYVNDLSKPALEIPRLEGSQKTGSIAFDGNCILANLKIQPDKVEDLSGTAGNDFTDHDANYLRKWQWAMPIILPNGCEPYFKNLPKDSLFNGHIKAERKGLINLTRQFGNNSERKLVWLKTNINATSDLMKILQLGFSDEVWVFVNKQFAYTDKNLYRLTNVRKYPDGRLSIQNANFPIQLKKGGNEILIGVANDFYGWGIVARLMDLDGISY
jgi:hypothetical protein